jgi:hypothetical protein
MYVYMYVYMYVCMYICTSMHACIYVCMYVCMYVCIYVCVYVNTSDKDDDFRQRTDPHCRQTGHPTDDTLVFNTRPRGLDNKTYY